MKPVFVVLLLSFSVSFNHSFAQKSNSAVKKLKDRSPHGILTYLNKITKDSLLLVGQHAAGEDNDQVKGYQLFFEDLHSQTGKYPGLLGLEYGQTANVPYDVVNQLLIDHWNKGGLVALTWCVDNPFKDGPYTPNWNAVAHKDSIDLKSLLSDAPESHQKKNYRDELMRVGNSLKKLQDAGVVALWRPFQEMNCAWFWWGVNDYKQPTNIHDFQLLWQDMRNTFDKMGIKNLIWVYAPSVPISTLSRDVIVPQYPGDHYVDIVGMDIYKTPTPDFKENYELLNKFKKTICIGECGANVAAGPDQSKNLLDVNELIEKYKGKASYFLVWHSWTINKRRTKVRMAIVDDLHANEMMNSPEAVTLDAMR